MSFKTKQRMKALSAVFVMGLAASILAKPILTGLQEIIPNIWGDTGFRVVVGVFLLFVSLRIYGSCLRKSSRN